MAATKDDADRLIADFTDAIKDHQITFAEMGKLSADLTILVLDLSDLKTDLADEADLIAFVTERYDRHIAPIDIPRVPGIIETIIDNAAKSVLTGAIREGFVKLRAA